MLILYKIYEKKSINCSHHKYNHYLSLLIKKLYSAIPIIHELTCVYILLHNAIREFPKLEKYGLGASIEKILLDCVKQTFFGTVIPPGARKLDSIATTSSQFDTLKLYTLDFLQN